MANYKLTNDYWETSGVYDITQGKTQREINADLKTSAESTIKPETVSGSIATFEGGEGVPLKSLVVNIEPAQAGSGDPSPDNVRPITGWTGANVYRSGADTSNPTTYNITFPTEAGTVYGGTLDVTNGVLTVDKKSIMLDDTMYTQNGSSVDSIRIYVDAPNDTMTWSDQTALSGKIWCNNFAESTNSQTVSGTIGIHYRANGSQQFVFGFGKSGAIVQTASEAVQWLNNNDVQVVYTLATPITYTLTPTEVKALLGTNNVWADCGTVDVQYGAYLTVVENQLGEKIPKVAVAPIEKTTTASKEYAVNEMFFMGDKLYIATASIASGATFTVGTNCAKTTIGEILTTLLNA